MPLEITIANRAEEIIQVPPWVIDLGTFRRWVDEDVDLDKIHVCYHRGRMYIDMAREQLYTHNVLKGVITSVLVQLVRERDLGDYFTDGVFLSNVDADLGNKPDGLFVSHNSFATGAVRDVAGEEGGYVELQGTPDLVIEIVSRSSVKKDTEILMEAYWEAGIPEHWLIDARQEPVRFDILNLAAGGYRPTRRVRGWTRSSVFGVDFRLVEQPDGRGRPKFSLEWRER
jgi:Uma2 family endonuclease